MGRWSGARWKRQPRRTRISCPKRWTSRVMRSGALQWGRTTCPRLQDLLLLGFRIPNTARPRRQRECDRYRAGQAGKWRLGTRPLRSGTGRASLKKIISDPPAQIASPWRFRCVDYFVVALRLQFASGCFFSGSGDPNARSSVIPKIFFTLSSIKTGRPQRVL